MVIIEEYSATLAGIDEIFVGVNIYTAKFLAHDGIATVVHGVVVDPFAFGEFQPYSSGVQCCQPQVAVFVLQHIAYGVSQNPVKTVVLSIVAVHSLARPYENLPATRPVKREDTVVVD